MAIPKMEEMLLPMLQAFRTARTVQEIKKAIAIHFAIREEEQRIMLPSQKQSRFSNRVGWAKTTLRQSRLIHKVDEKRFQITPRGLELLETGITKITITLLRQYPEFDAIIRRKPLAQESDGGSDQTSDRAILVQARDQTENNQIFDLATHPICVKPDDHELDQRIKEHLQQCRPFRFEAIIRETMRALGYTIPRHNELWRIASPHSNEITGLLFKDALGLERVYIRARQDTIPVERAHVQRFVTELANHNVDRGIFITTAAFTKQAEELVTLLQINVVLIDGGRLASIMREYELGITSKAVVVVRTIEPEYFA